MLKIISSLPAVGKRALFVYTPPCTISPQSTSNKTNNAVSL